MSISVLTSLGPALELETRPPSEEETETGTAGLRDAQTQAFGSILLKNETKQNFAVTFPGMHNPFQIFIVSFFFFKPVHNNTIALYLHNSLLYNKNSHVVRLNVSDHRP